MEKVSSVKDIVLLFEKYSTESRNLHKSFVVAGKSYTAVVIEEDGFLEDGVISVFGSFLGGMTEGKPRYFNQVVAPKFWEISGNNTSGKIHNLNHERARIFYAEPKHKRFVKDVDWLDDKGVVRVSDHYNKYGYLYAKTMFNGKGQKVTKTYYDGDGKEVVVRNYVTGDIILNDGPKIRFFKNIQKFVEFFLEKNDMINSRIFYNTLAMPFSVSHHLPSVHKEDMLFWNEPIGNEVPGNMQLILHGNSPRTEKIMVQRRDAYEKLIELGVDSSKIEKLGYCYDFQKENTYKKQALICTNSDNIAHCAKLIEALPDMHFHIAAITEMSSKLMAMGSYDNVTLYPGIKASRVKDLFKRCDYYFDINYGSEILSAVWTAFLHNHAIFAFDETVHNQMYIPKEHIYAVGDVDKLIENVKMLMNDKAKVGEYIEVQKAYAMSESVNKYQNI